MGMASSQARLLMLTSRLHDVEFKTQQIQNAKVALATQQEEVYAEYQKALDATTLTFTALDLNTAEKSNLAATFNNLFSINRQHAVGGNYLLIDSRGRVVVDDDVYEGYQNYSTSHFWGGNYADNAYQFAWYMVEGQRNGHQLWHDFHDSVSKSPLEAAIDEIFRENKDDMESKYNEICNILDEVYGVIGEGSTGWWNYSAWGHPPLHSILVYTQLQNYNNHNFSDEQNEVINEFINYFWSKYGSQVFTRVNDNEGSNINGDPYELPEFNYYVQIYNAIQAHGGCISIDDFANSAGSVADDADWLTAMIECGQLSMETITIDKDGKAKLKSISVSSDTNLNYTTTSSIDKTALAKAEAKYEHDLKVINRKETKLDNELNNLETERNAITKEYDSVKTVIKDNQERTFKIFS